MGNYRVLAFHSMNQIKEFAEKLRVFCAERDWEKFQTPKDLALSVSIEAAEVLEHFQWRTNEQLVEYCREHRDEIGEELADVFIYLVYLSEKLGVDLLAAAEKKMEKNKGRFPIEKVKGKLGR